METIKVPVAATYIFEDGVIVDTQLQYQEVEKQGFQDAFCNMIAAAFGKRKREEDSA